MKVDVSQIAAWTDGIITGDSSLSISAARPLADAGPEDLTFLDSEKHLNQLLACPARVAIVPRTLTVPGRTTIGCHDPMQAFICVYTQMYPRRKPAHVGIHPRAQIDPTAQIGIDCQIEPGAVIQAEAQLGPRCRIMSGAVIGAGCRLAEDVTIYPNVVLYPDTIVGSRTIIHANSVIGADGFGYRFQNGQHTKIPQLGIVEIGADVEIGACTTIDRATFGVTRIGDGTKIDNLVQIAHNCHVGRHNLFISQVGMAGSCTTGDYVVMAGQVGVADHVSIGEGTVIGAKAGVTKNVPAGQKLLGAPATPVRDQQRILMTMERLPEMRRDVQRIIKHLGLDG